MSEPPASALARVVPEPDAVSAPYWEAAARHELRLPRCARCERIAVPPAATCPHCASADPEYRWEPVSGRGVVRSWTVVRQAFLPGFETPYTLVDVELDDVADVRLIGRLVDSDEGLGWGAAVDVAFEDIAAGVSVPAFALRAVTTDAPVTEDAS